MQGMLHYLPVGKIYKEVHHKHLMKWNVFDKSGLKKFDIKDLSKYIQNLNHIDISSVEKAELSTSTDISRVEKAESSTFTDISSLPFIA